MKNRREGERGGEKISQLAILLLVIDEHFAPSSDSKIPLSFSLRFLFHGLAITRFFSDFLGFRAWGGRKSPKDRGKRGETREAQGENSKMQRGREPGGGTWKGANNGAHDLRGVPLGGTHWFQMFPTSHLYRPPCHNRANIENAFSAKNRHIALR